MKGEGNTVHEACQNLAKNSANKKIMVFGKDYTNEPHIFRHAVKSFLTLNFARSESLRRKYDC